MATGRGTCLLDGCGWAGPVEVVAVAQSRSVWHVYEVHPEVWRALAFGLGGRPTCPRPEGVVR
jgi:hypothetical protein